MSVVIGYEEAGPWRKKVTIEVPAPAVEAEIGRVVNDLRHQVRLPGFRKGKVPAQIVRRRFPEEIQQRVAEKLVPRYWRQAEAEKNLDPLVQPQIELGDFEPGAAMTFIATVETRPEIELGDLERFDLPEGEVEPGEQELADARRDLLRSHARWETVERSAATGDLVLGKVFEIPTAGEDSAGEGLDNVGEGEGSGGDEGPEGRPMRIEIGADGADEELSLALTGLGAGQSTTFRRTLGEGEAAREQEYRLEVGEVQEEHLPEFDDDFAKKLGESSAAELEDKLREHLRGAKKRELDASREAALLTQLRERHPLELPTGIVDREVQGMVREQASRLSAQGVDLEKTPIDWESIIEQMRPEAQKRVHNRLLLDAIAREKELKVDEERFERVLASIAAQHGKSSLQVRQELAESGRLNDLRTDMLAERTVRHLMGEDTLDAEANESKADSGDGDSEED